MSEHSPTERPPESPDDAERAVADYLHVHPDFFERHLDLLESLKVPHPSGGAISLIERQVQRLQHENHRIKAKVLQMVENARENERINGRMHGLALALLDAGSLDEVVITVDDIFRNDFNATAVSLRLLAPEDGRGAEWNTPLVTAGDKGFEPLRHYLDRHRPDCERLNAEALGFLFGEEGDRIKSTVVIPLYGAADYGLLVVGSEDADRFHPGMGTHYLERMGEVVSRALQSYLA